jgi:hypothetical protein
MEMEPGSKFMRVVSTHPNTAAIVFGCVIGMIILGMAEVACFVMESRVRARLGEVQYSADDFIQHDELLGAKPKSNMALKVAKADGAGNALWRAEYSIDALGRRVTPTDHSEPKKATILFFGCSFAFGEGLNDDETLPYYVGKDAPCYRTVNYGFIGYGPQQTLARLQDDKALDELRGSNVILVYAYMGEPKVGHIDRAIGSLHLYGWARHFPYYHVDPSGRLVRDGSFKTGRPCRDAIYSALRKSAVVRFLGINIPWSIRQDHVDLAARIIEESRNVFKERFHSDEFYVVSFPGAEPSTNKALMAALAKAGIRVLDYSGLKMSGPDYRIPVDEHPTAKWNKELAALIVRDLGLACERTSREGTFANDGFMPRIATARSVRVVPQDLPMEFTCYPPRDVSSWEHAPLL